MCTIMHAAIDTLPDVPKTKHFARETSSRTKALIEERVKLGRRKNRTKKDFKKLQKQIKDSTLQDFNMWVEKWVTEMQKANEVGDSKKVWKAVKTLSGKVNLQPPKNLTVAQGEPIDSPNKLAEVHEPAKHTK